MVRYGSCRSESATLPMLQIVVECGLASNSGSCDMPGLVGGSVGPRKVATFPNHHSKLLRGLMQQWKLWSHIYFRAVWRILYLPTYVIKSYNCEHVFLLKEFYLHVGSIDLLRWVDSFMNKKWITFFTFCATLLFGSTNCPLVSNFQSWAHRSLKSLNRSWANLHFGSDGAP